MIYFKNNNLIADVTGFVAATDLGLKTFATLSIFDGKSKIDREFLDEKHLGGKKNNWFVSPDKLNLKGKLFERRFEVRNQQSIRMRAKNSSVRHWHARVVEKCGWKKIGNIHKELIHQIATRLITYLNFHEVSRLVLENLKWSRHVSRSLDTFFHTGRYTGSSHRYSNNWKIWPDWMELWLSMSIPDIHPRNAGDVVNLVVAMARDLFVRVPHVENIRSILI